jgi:hypothetical protein
MKWIHAINKQFLHSQEKCRKDGSVLLPACYSFLSTEMQKIMLYPIVLKEHASCSSNKVHTQDDNQTE